MKWLVKYNFTVYQPVAWAGSLPRLFGANNDGFIVEAPTIQDVKYKLRSENIINPFYVTITHTEG